MACRATVVCLFSLVAALILTTSGTWAATMMAADPESPGNQVSVQDLDPVAHITGTVRSSTGVPLEGIRVAAFGQVPPSGWIVTGIGETGADGTYDCVIWGESASYRLLFADLSRTCIPRYSGTESAFLPEDATLYTVAAGGTVAGVDETMTVGGKVTGTALSAASGEPLVHEQVWIAEAWVEEPGGGRWVVPENDALLWGSINDNGDYMIGGLESTRFRVRFHDDGARPTSMGSMHLWTYHDAAYDPSRATSVTVIGTGTTTGVALEPIPARARIAGVDRYQTALEGSRYAFATGTADEVVIVSGEAFPDALAASGLGGAVRGPVLLTRGGALPPGLSEEIARLGADTVYVVGGEAAVSNPVFESLDDLSGVTAIRLAGADRYETAAVVAGETLDRAGTRASESAFVIRGDDFADGMSVACLAYSAPVPVLLTRPDALSSETAEAIDGLGLTNITVAGGTAAVSERVADSIAVLNGGATTVQRVSGADRYATALALAEYGMGRSWADDKLVMVLSGTTFADGLSGGATCGALYGVQLLVSPASAARVALAMDDSLRLDPYWMGDAVTVLGGEAAVSVQTESTIREWLAPSSYE